MEGDLVFCFVAFGLDLGVVFLSEFGRRKESVCMWVFFSFFLRSGIVFLGGFFFFNLFLHLSLCS